MKYLRIASDIHLDFDIDLFNRSRRHLAPEIRQAGEMAFLWLPPQMDEDLETTMVLAGDLWTSSKYLSRKYPDGKSWMEKVSKQFKYVVFVLGNHDYWGGNISDEAIKVKRSLKDSGLNNVFLLEKDSVVLDGIKFVGATLWTDFNKHDKGVLMDAANLMNDYKKIRYSSSYSKVKPSNIAFIHNEAKSYIFNNAIKDNDEQKLIVVSHMPPSIQSIEEVYRNNPKNINYLYYSDLEEEVLKADIDLWIHGHNHNFSSYSLGKTHVLSNPRGYVNQESYEFDGKFRISIEELAKKNKKTIKP